MDSDSETSWEVLQPSAKSSALPLPSCFHQRTPRIPALHQVSSASSSAPPRHARVTPPREGRPLPRRFHSNAVATDSASLTIDWIAQHGVPLPDLGNFVPASLQLADSSTDASLESSIQPIDIAPRLRLSKELKRVHASTGPSSYGKDQLTRVKLASTSPLVLAVWSQVFPALSRISKFLQSAAESPLEQEHIHRFLNRFAASTLVKHLTALKSFLQLCATMCVDYTSISEFNLADILINARLVKDSSGSGPMHSSTLKAIRWAATHLEIAAWSGSYSSIIQSFLKQKLCLDRKEALPHSLYILVQWERRILQKEATDQEVILLGGFLFLLFSGLRFSDAQRTDLHCWRLDAYCLRGLAWRAKTCSSTTPFGIVNAGFLSHGSFTWIHKYLQVLDSLYQSCEFVDFVFPSFQGQMTLPLPPEPMAYGEAQYFLRKFLSLPWKSSYKANPESSWWYSLHGLKATLVSWALQLQIPEEQRRLHAKRRGPNQSTTLYSRDDVAGAMS